MRRRKVGLIVCLTLLMTTAVFPQAWRGIVPLRSTRADVLKIMGKPDRLGYIYDLENGTVRVMYNREKCETGLPSDWGNWNVPPDTVIHINVEVDIPVRKLGIKNFEQYKWYTDHAGTYYRLPKEGLEYHVQEDRITAIVYGPRESDKDLMCVQNPSRDGDIRH